MRAFSAPWALLAAGALPALAGVGLLAIRLPSNEATSAQPPVPPAAAPIIAARAVCSFANEDAAAALVDGADGGQSVVVDGRSYWLFGDTLFAAASGKQIEANTLAWSDTRDEHGCPELTYHARGGIAVPFLEKDGSLTVWPSGTFANDDGTIDVFTVYIYGSGPWAYWTGEVGVTRVDPASMRVEVTARRLFDAASGFRSQVIAAQPVDEDADERLRIVLQLQSGEKILARVASASIHEFLAYEYWDGEAWSDDPGVAAPLWDVAQADDPTGMLGAFEGSTHISWSDAFDAYVAISNAGYASVGARFADRLEGPWSDAVSWLDCSAFAGPRVPVCYTPALHPQFSEDGSLFVTVTRFGEYDIVAYELTPGAPVHEYRHGDAIVYGFEAPGDDWEDLGVAFHASRTPADGLAPIYRWQRDGEVAYAPQAPGADFIRDDAAAFYASLAAPAEDSPIVLRPVYGWSDGTAHLLSTMDSGLERYGFVRGKVAFYTPRRS